jgi:putative ABC transport system permease protein
MRDLLADVRYGLRSLRRTPLFTSVAVLILALGIGGNTALFTMIYAVLLRPHFPDAARLVTIFASRPDSVLNFPVSIPDFLDVQRQSRSFERLAAYDTLTMNLRSGDKPVALNVAAVTPQFHDVLGVPPAIGRSFTADEDQPGKSHVAIVSHHLWVRESAALGATVVLNGNPYTVVGVMPEDYGFPNRQDVWIPLEPAQTDLTLRGVRTRTVIGRVKPGVAVSQARAELVGIGAALEKAYPLTNGSYGLTAVPLQEAAVAETRPLLFVLLGAVGFVLLIVCANIANLLMARGSGRRREVAIRNALGAGRRRVIRQLLTESGLLALLGGLVGLFPAFGGIELMCQAGERLIPTTRLGANIFPDAGDARLAMGVIVAALGLSIVTGILFGLAPALRISRADIGLALRGRGADSGDREQSRTRGLLVVVEVALSLILLAGAGLLLRSFTLLRSARPGFDPSNVLTMSVSLPRQQYATPAARTGFYKQTLERVQTLPGVRAGAAVTFLPIANNLVRAFYVGGRPLPKPADRPFASHRVITPDYFTALGIPLRQGRFFTWQDNADNPDVVIVNQSFARVHFPNQDPIGRQIRNSTAGAPWRTIVGVVADAREVSLRADPTPAFYYPLAQDNQTDLSLAIKTAGNPRALIRAVTREIRNLDADLTVAAAQTMDEALAATLARDQLAAVLLAAFAVLALLVTAIGLYGVVAYGVTQRTVEIGIRMALGAGTRDVLRLVLGSGMSLVFAGLAVGIAGAVGLTRLLDGFLYGTSATDPVILGAVTVLLIIVALAANLVPARRAAVIDPVIALRGE